MTDGNCLRSDCTPLIQEDMSSENEEIGCGEALRWKSMYPKGCCV